MQAITQPSPTGLSAVGLVDSAIAEYPNSKFILAHPPGEYEFDGEQWLPVVKHLALRPGVNGVQSGEGGWSRYFGRLVGDGWTIIDPMPTGGVLVTGDDGSMEETPGYLIPWACRRGKVKGTHYADVWSTPTAVGGGARASVSWHFDRAGWDAWRLRLMETGALPQPRSVDVQHRIIVQRKRSERHIASAHDGAPHIQAKGEREQGRLAAMEAATAGLQTPKPKRRKRPTKRPAATGV